MKFNAGRGKINVKLLQLFNSLRQLKEYVASSDGPSWRRRSSADVGCCVEARAGRLTVSRRTLKADGRQLAEKYVVALFALRIIFACRKTKR